MADDPQTIGGIPIRSEPIGFSAGELIACGNCARTNPPNRLDCFYCGGALELPVEIAEGIPLKLSEIESWELGVNIVVTGGLDSVDPQAVAAAVAIDPEMTASLSTIEIPLPLFRLHKDEAEEVAGRLSRLGLSVERVEDSSLSLEKPLIRLKGMTFGDHSWELHPFNSGDPTVVEISDIALVVIGSLTTTTAESKLKKKRKEIKEFDEHLASTDHAVIDIFTTTNETGFRILPHGFDFSCLGERKSLLAAENVKSLLKTLEGLATNALFDRSYSSKSAILDRVWPRTVANTSKGIERNWYGVQRGVGSTTSNEEQFTRYSRMRRKLI